jgi:predicted nucleic acid-binding protein
MARILEVRNELFMDSSYAIALGSPRDRHHVHAATLAHTIEATRIRVVTTQAVVVEVGNALSKRIVRNRAVALLDLFDRNPLIEVAPISEELFERGTTLFRRHQDKDWGLTDCISFVVMRDRGLTDALTADAHFRQAGFRALLRSA